MFNAKHAPIRGGKFMVFLGLVLLIGAMAPANAVLKAKWRYSSANTKWVAEIPLTLQTYAAQANEVDLDTTKIYQTMDGWGGSPNEVGMKDLYTLPKTLQDSVIKLLFDTVSVGCKFNWIRLPIGCSDFSLNDYTLDTVPGAAGTRDDSMKYVSIRRDTSSVSGTIPFCLAAQKYNPTLKVWGSPWSAPSWMKNNDAMHGGTAMSGQCSVKQDSATLTAYALYFSKAITLYQQAGLPYFALAFQNEPRVCQPFPSTEWSGTSGTGAMTPGAEMENFMHKYLYPRMHADHPDILLWTPTMNVSDTNYFTPMLRDTVTKLAATCVQYEGKDAITYIHGKFPKLKVYATELVCGGGDNPWSYALNPTFSDLKFYITTGGASGACQWNLILDKRGNSGPDVNFLQNSMITMDTVAKSITLQPQYYALKHFSYYIRPGARVIGISGNYAANVVAVKNTSGSIAVVAQNAGSSTVNYGVRLGTQMVTVSMPASSIGSFLIYDSTGTAVHQVAAPESRPLMATTSFRAAGENFAIPAAFAGRKISCAVFSLQGKLVREVSMKRSGNVSFSRDLGIPEGAYTVRIKTL